jgi:hypothetical protein
MNIEQLLKKFYEGDATQEEERLLTDYFLNEENQDDRWKEDRQVFRLLHDTQIQIPTGVSERLEEALDTLNANDATSRKYHITHKLYYWISSAAAIVLLCIGLFFVTREASPPQMADTFSDPKEAALVAEQTLVFISAHLNNGLNKAAVAEHELEKASQLINKHLNK